LRFWPNGHRYASTLAGFLVSTLLEILAAGSTCGAAAESSSPCFNPS